MKTKVKGRNLTFGTDVEGGIYHVGMAKYIPCTHFNTPFTKENRAEHEDNPKRTYHRDNILIEFQTEPVNDLETFVDETKACARWLKQVVHERIPRIDVRFLPVILFKEEAMTETDEAAEMGCDPDYCAYTGVLVDGPQALRMDKLRFGSGHLHIGGVEDMDFETQCRLVQWLDVYVGRQCAAIEVSQNRGWVKRREFYGQAGRFRVKPYGIEYRTPSNAWVNALLSRYQDAPVLHMLSGIQSAVEATDRGLEPEDYVDMASLRKMIDGEHDRGYDWAWSQDNWARDNGKAAGDLREELDV